MDQCIYQKLCKRLRINPLNHSILANLLQMNSRNLPNKWTKTFILSWGEEEPLKMKFWCNFHPFRVTGFPQMRKFRDQKLSELEPKPHPMSSKALLSLHRVGVWHAEVGTISSGSFQLTHHFGAQKVEIRLPKTVEELRRQRDGVVPVLEHFLRDSDARVRPLLLQKHVHPAAQNIPL